MNILILAAALTIGAGPYVVQAAGRMAEQGDITATVDMQRLFVESDLRTVALRKSDEYGRVMGQRFDEIAGSSYLTPGEVADYSEALQTVPATDASKKKIADLKAKASKLSEEAQGLAAKKDAELNAADKARNRELAMMQAAWREAMNRMKQVYQEKVNDEVEKQMRIAQAELRSVVQGIAKQQGIGQVFDSSVMVYSKVDLTPVVMGKLKKGNPAPPPANP
jgi:Skp family chaperone for outer membrane proteins